MAGDIAYVGKSRATSKTRTLNGLGARLLLDANFICKLDELPKIPPFFFAHQPSIGA